MGQISLSIPQTGQPNTTEDPKVASDLTTLQTVINGNLDDTNLASPNNATPRLLFQASGYFTTTFTSGITYILTDGVVPIASGATVGSAGLAFWCANSTNEFNVAGKTTKCQLRVGVYVNAVAPAITYTAGLYQPTALAGTGSNLTVTLGSAVGSSTVAIASPAASTGATYRSSSFVMPAPSAPLVLAVLVGGTAAVGSATIISAQLYGFNA